MSTSKIKKLTITDNGKITFSKSNLTDLEAYGLLNFIKERLAKKINSRMASEDDGDNRS